MNLQGSVVLVAVDVTMVLEDLLVCLSMGTDEQAFETTRPHINLLSCFRCLALQLWALDRLSFLSVSVWSK